MGAITQAVIQHNLSPSEIMTFAASLTSIEFIDGEGFNPTWTRLGIDVAYLEKYWKVTPEDIIQKGTWGVEDMALLENERISLHFYLPHLISFDNNLKSNIYNHNAEVKAEFDALAKSVALKMNAIDMIVIEDWYYDHAFDFDNKLTVDLIRRKLTATRLRFYEIDLTA